MGGQAASFSFPTAIVFGSGSLAGLAKRLRQMGGRRALVVTDKALVQTTAFDLLAREEGIIPALESAHAIAHTVKVAPTMKKNQILVVNLSGRGDKDVQLVAKMRGLTL